MCVNQRPYKKFFKKIFCKKFFITLTLILSLIKKLTAILFCKKMWITFLFLFFLKNIFLEKIKIKINL
jgi:hypothetical protein